MRHLLVLGDSHVQYFTFAAVNGLFEPFAFKVCRVIGATAAGLTNPNSFTAARPAFLSFLEKKPKDSVVVMHLGEVDCGILVWVRSQKNGTTVEQEVERAIDAYMTFIDELRADGWHDIVLTSATLPTINDEDQNGEIISIRRQAVSASQAARTVATHLFNNRLAAEAAARGLTFIDAKPVAIDPETQLVDTRFRNRNPADHHMDDAWAGLMWSELLAGKLRPTPPVKKQRFVAKTDTFIKTMLLPSGDLPPEHVVACPRGARITGRPVKTKGGNIILRDVSSPNVDLLGCHRVLYAAHWKTLPQAGQGKSSRGTGSRGTGAQGASQPADRAEAAE